MIRGAFGSARVWLPALLVVLCIVFAVQTGEWRQAGVMAAVVLGIALVLARWSRGDSGPAQ